MGKYQNIVSLSLATAILASSCSPRNNNETVGDMGVFSCAPLSGHVYDMPARPLEISGYQGRFNKDTETVEINKKLIIQKALEMGVPEDKAYLYLQAVLYHEACIHGQDTQTMILFPEPLSISEKNSMLGKSVTGTVGLRLLIEKHNGDTQMEQGIIEMLATYLMFNNNTINRNVYDFPGLHMQGIAQNRLYIIGEALQERGLFDFYEIAELLRQDEEESTRKAWRLLLLGHEVDSTDENGQLYAEKLIAFLNGFSTEYSDKDDIVRAYFNHLTTAR